MLEKMCAVAFYTHLSTHTNSTNKQSKNQHSVFASTANLGPNSTENDRLLISPSALSEPLLNNGGAPCNIEGDDPDDEPEVAELTIVQRYRAVIIIQYH